MPNSVNVEEDFIHMIRKAPDQIYHYDITVNGKIPVDCEYYPWGDWSSCTVTCGGLTEVLGIRLRNRKIKTHEMYGGKVCDGTASIDGLQTHTEKEACNTQTCPPSMNHLFYIAWQSNT